MEKKYLEMTKMLNFDVESIQSLIKNRKWIELDEYNKIAAIYDFVRNEILFGYNSSDLLSAEEVLKDGYGQCNTKATLLMALLRSVGIPCRLHGSEVSKHFQRGATSWLISDVINVQRDEDGIATMSIYDFLLNENSLEM